MCMGAFRFHSCVGHVTQSRSGLEFRNQMFLYPSFYELPKDCIHPNCAVKLLAKLVISPLSAGNGYPRRRLNSALRPISSMQLSAT